MTTSPEKKTTTPARLLDMTLSRDVRGAGTNDIVRAWPLDIR
jgi:hypothetical protein